MAMALVTLVLMTLVTILFMTLVAIALLTQNAMTPCACAHHIPHRSTLSAQMHPIQVLLFPLRVLIPHKPMHV